MDKSGVLPPLHLIYGKNLLLSWKILCPKPLDGVRRKTLGIFGEITVPLRFPVQAPTLRRGLRPPRAQPSLRDVRRKRLSLRVRFANSPASGRNTFVIGIPLEIL